MYMYQEQVNINICKEQYGIVNTNADYNATRCINVIFVS